MSTVIVYYSKDNNTREGAKILEEKLKAKIIELKEIKKGNFIQALRKKSSKLKGTPWKDIENSAKLYLMSPIWASNVVPAINAFLDNANLTGKEITIITFQQFNDLKNSKKVHNCIKNRIEQKNGTVLNCYALLGGKMGHFAGKDNIKTEIEKIFN